MWSSSALQTDCYQKMNTFRPLGQLLLALDPGGDESRPETDALGSVLHTSAFGSSYDVQIGDMGNKVMWLDLR